MIGSVIKYNGFKTMKSGHTVEAVCYAYCIGYDETWIYTGFCKNHVWGKAELLASGWPEFDGTIETVGRHYISASRLIQVMPEDFKLPGRQISLFTDVNE